jgi:hypothetical protein
MPSGIASPSPVEYVLIEFPGDRFHGDIAPAIADLVDRGVVRVLDLVFVKKDAEGGVTSFEYDDLEETATFTAVEGEADGLFSDDDVAVLGASLAPGSAALCVLWEDLWAGDLARAVRAAGGEVVDGGRIPHDLVVACLDAVATERGEVPA